MFLRVGRGGHDGRSKVKALQLGRSRQFRGDDTLLRINTRDKIRSTALFNHDRDHSSCFLPLTMSRPELQAPPEIVCHESVTTRSSAHANIVLWRCGGVKVHRQVSTSCSITMSPSPPCMRSGYMTEIPNSQPLPHLKMLLIRF